MPKFLWIALFIYSASGIILITVPNTNTFLVAAVALIKLEYEEGATFEEALQKHNSSLRVSELALFPVLNTLAAPIVLLIWVVGIVETLRGKDQEITEWYEEELSLYISGGDPIIVEITNSFLTGKRIRGESVEVYSLKREVDGQVRGISGFKYSDKNPEGKWALLVPYSTIVEVTDADVNHEETYDPKEI